MSTQEVKFYRTNQFWSFVAVCVLFSPPFVWYFLTKPEWDRRRLASEKMELAILQLSEKCPGELSEAQWAYCITWTLTLHGNFGSSPSPGHVPTDDLERITNELNRRIDAGADLGTINWIWDQYIVAYPRAARYEVSYRPTGDTNKHEFEQLKNSEYISHPLPEVRERYKEKLAELQQKG